MFALSNLSWHAQLICKTKISHAGFSMLVAPESGTCPMGLAASNGKDYEFGPTVGASSFRYATKAASWTLVLSALRYEATECLPFRGKSKQYLLIGF
jgi:hypothetical protein